RKFYYDYLFDCFTYFSSDQLLLNSSEIFSQNSDFVSCNFIDFIYSNSFFVYSLGFSIYNIISYFLETILFYSWTKHSTFLLPVFRTNKFLSPSNAFFINCKIAFFLWLSITLFYIYTIYLYIFINIHIYILRICIYTYILIVLLYYIHLLYPFSVVEGYLDCFHILAIVNHFSVNSGMH
ncbi:unnamed protein product, partial [Rangifer tarandus platyrhynchus]